MSRGRVRNTLHKYFSGPIRSYRYSYPPVKSFRQLFFSNSLALLKSKPVKSIKKVNLRHKLTRRKNIIDTSRKRRMDLAGFTSCENNAEIEIQAEIESQEKRDILSPVASEHSSSAEEEQEQEDISTETSKQLEALRRQVECLQSTNSVLQEKMESLNSNKRKKNSSTGEQTTKKPRYKQPPPPTSGLVGSTGKDRSTLFSFLQTLAAMITVKVEDYAEGYQAFAQMEGTKAPISAMKIISDLLIDWYNVSLSLDGKACLFDSLLSCYATKLSTKYISPAISDSLSRFFRSFAAPGTSGPNQYAVSPSSATTTQRYPTTTSSMTATGEIPPVSAGVSNVGSHFLRAARPRNLQRFVPKIFAELQTISAREGDNLYTSKSRTPNGSTIVKLEIYNKDQVEGLTRDKWWPVAEFRGTLMTDNKEILQAASGLMDLMETEMENKKDVECVQSSISSIQSRYKSTRS